LICPPYNILIGKIPIENKSSKYKSINKKILDSIFSNSAGITAYSFSPESIINLEVENSLFLNNNAGIQTFGPVELYSKNNLFSNNINGILFHFGNSKGILINNTVDSKGDAIGFAISNKGNIELKNNIILNNNYDIYNEGEIIQTIIIWGKK